MFSFIWFVFWPLRGVVLTNIANKVPRRPLAKAREEARLVDEGAVVAVLWLNCYRFADSAEANEA